MLIRRIEFYLISVIIYNVYLKSSPFIPLRIIVTDNNYKCNDFFGSTSVSTSVYWQIKWHSLMPMADVNCCFPIHSCLVHTLSTVDYSHYFPSNVMCTCEDSFGSACSLQYIPVTFADVIPSVRPLRQLWSGGWHMPQCWNNTLMESDPLVCISISLDPR